MSNLPEVIVVPAPGHSTLAPPGRHEPLDPGGEIVHHNGFWRWAQAQGMAIVIEDPTRVEQHRRQHSPDGDVHEGDVEQARLEREQEMEAARAEMADLLQQERKAAAARESQLLEEVARAQQAASDAETARAKAEAKLLEASKPAADGSAEPTLAPATPVEEAKKSKK